MPNLFCLNVVGSPVNGTAILLVQLDPAYFLYQASHDQLLTQACSLSLVPVKPAACKASSMHVDCCLQQCMPDGCL